MEGNRGKVGRKGGKGELEGMRENGSRNGKGRQLEKTKRVLKQTGDADNHDSLAASH